MDSAVARTGKTPTHTVSLLPGQPSSSSSSSDPFPVLTLKPQPLSPAGLQALAATILRGFRTAMVTGGKGDGAGGGLPLNLAPLAACITAVYLQAARRVLLLLALDSSSKGYASRGGPGRVFV
jgi:hypothetical protein